MAQSAQTYKNHPRFLPPFHFFVVPVLLANVINEARHMWANGPNQGNTFAVVVALALLTLAFLARIQALTVQDRVIRLEMRERLRQILPADMHAQINGLTPKQLVSLRFAGDGEMPDIVRDVVSGKLQSAKDIKLRVKNWQGDFLRA